MNLNYSEIRHWRDARATTGRDARATLSYVALALGLILPPCLAGCASDPPGQMTLTSSQRGKTFAEQFAAAYLARDASGDSDLVLIDQSTQQMLTGHRDDAPVRQVMHIRVLWRAGHDVLPDHRSAANATIHWYVIGNARSSNPQVLEYDGTALVGLKEEAAGVQLSIHNAAVRPVACSGGLRDPIGECWIDGAMHADVNPAKVAAALAGVRTVIAAVESAPDNASYHAGRSARPESPSSSAR